MAALLPTVTKVSDDVGNVLGDADEFRVKAPLSIARVPNVGSGPPRLELSVSGGIVVGITAGPGISITGTGTAPVISGVPATTSDPGTMSETDKAKLDTVGAGAQVQQIQLQGALTFGVGSTLEVPIISIPAASPFDDGSQSIAHFVLVNGATSANTTLRLVQRGANGEIAVGVVTADGLLVSGASSSFASDVGLTPKYETYSPTIEMVGREGGMHYVTLTGDTHFEAPIAHASGGKLCVRVMQGSGGSHLATWESGGSGGFVFGPGFSGTLIATSLGDADYFEFRHFETPSSHWLCTLHIKYSTP